MRFGPGLPGQAPSVTRRLLLEVTEGGIKVDILAGELVSPAINYIYMYGRSHDPRESPDHVT